MTDTFKVLAGNHFFIFLHIFVATRGQRLPEVSGLINPAGIRTRDPHLQPDAMTIRPRRPHQTKILFLYSWHNPEPQNLGYWIDITLLKLLRKKITEYAIFRYNTKRYLYRIIISVVNRLID